MVIADLKVAYVSMPPEHAPLWRAAVRAALALILSAHPEIPGAVETAELLKVPA